MTEVTSKECVFLRDVRAAKICHRGARDWCAVHNINWSDLLGDGVPVQVLLDTRDPLAERVIVAARAR
jgi:hypothetical protein